MIAAAVGGNGFIPEGNTCYYQEELDLLSDLSYNEIT